MFFRKYMRDMWQEMRGQRWTSTRRAGWLLFINFSGLKDVSLQENQRRKIVSLKINRIPTVNNKIWMHLFYVWVYAGIFIPMASLPVKWSQWLDAVSHSNSCRMDAGDNGARQGTTVCVWGRCGNRMFANLWLDTPSRLPQEWLVMIKVWELLEQALAWT